MAKVVTISDDPNENDICLVDKNGNLVWRMMFGNHSIRLQANNGDLRVYPDAPYALIAVVESSENPRVFKFCKNYFDAPEMIKL